MWKSFSKALTYILHPLFMPVLGVFIILNSGTYISYMPGEGKKFVMLIVFLCTVVLPLSILPFFLYRNIISSVSLHNRKERFYPYLFTAFFYYLAFYLTQRTGMPALVQTFILGTAVTVFMVLLVNVFWKISAHMAGLGGVTGLIAALIERSEASLTLLLIIFILLSGLLGSARLHSGSHTPAQVYTGYLTGFVIVFLIALLK